MKKTWVDFNSYYYPTHLKFLKEKWLKDLIILSLSQISILIGHYICKVTLWMQTKCVSGRLTKEHMLVFQAKFLSDAVTEAFWERVLADGITIQRKISFQIHTYFLVIQMPKDFLT